MGWRGVAKKFGVATFEVGFARAPTGFGVWGGFAREGDLHRGPQGSTAKPQGSTASYLMAHSLAQVLEDCQSS